MQTQGSVVDVTEKYYDSDDADRFYSLIWGGEDIHIGLYDLPAPTGRSLEQIQRDIFAASRRTVERMAAKIEPLLGPAAVVADLGAGYGGSARYLAERYRCRVRCLNLSETQNRRNQKMTREQGLDSLVDVVHANFEDVPLESGSVDLVWSQDAFLHSGRRERVLQEARRILKPGGQLVFTDPMQADDCPAGVLKPVLDRIHLETLASVRFYRSAASELGFAETGFEDLTPQLVAHYTAVRSALEGRYDEMIQKVSRAYVDRMLTGLSHWVDAGQKGYLAWGILQFTASA